MSRKPTRQTDAELMPTSTGLTKTSDDGAPPANLDLHRAALSRLKRRGVLRDYEAAVKAVLDQHALDVTAAGVIRVMAGLAEMRGMDTGDVRRAARLLTTDPEFRDVVRYGGSLTAVDFANALEQAPRPGEEYTPDECRRMRVRFGDDFAAAVRHTGFFDDGTKKFKYLPESTESE